MTPKQRRLIFILAGVGGLIGVASFGVIVWLTVRGITHAAPITEDEKRLVLTAKAFVAFGFEGYDPAAESFGVMRQFGVRTITNDYDSRKVPDAPRYLVLTSVTEVHPQALNAVQSFQMQKVAMKAGVALARGATMSDAPGLLRQTTKDGYAGVLRSGEPVGNVFVVRQGRAVHMVTVAGYYFEEPAEVKRLLGPLLEESKRQTERR